MEANTKMFSQTKQQGTVNRVQSKQPTVQQRPTVQKGANRNLQQGANRTVQQGLIHNPTKENLQKLEAVSALVSLQKETTPQKPVQASSGGGSTFAGIAIGILMALFGIICVIGYYIWYFLTHPMDDLKGIFHL